MASRAMQDAAYGPACSAEARFVPIRPAPEDVLQFWPVDKKVGQVRNDGPELIEPVPEMEPPLL